MIWIVLKWCGDQLVFIALGFAAIAALGVWIKHRIDLDYAPRRRLTIQRLRVDHLLGKKR